MKKMKIIALAGLLSVAPWAAADLSYTNFSVGYVDGDFFDVDVDGFDLRGNFALNSSFHLLAGYSALDADGGDIDILGFGGGWHTGLSETLDFVATASILDVDFDNFSSDGVRLTGGIRAQPSSEFEFYADFVYEDIDDFDDDTGYDIGGRYFFNTDTSAGIALRDVNDLETLRLDIRFDF